MIRRMVILTLLLGSLTGLFAQDAVQGKGALGLGLRTTGNLFPENNFKGFGAGGMWRLGFSDRVQTEWFADYITSTGEDDLWRRDYHIGWSVQFMLRKPMGVGSIQPYVLGGQCFDLTRMGHTAVQSDLVFSAAAQTGLGARVFVLPRMEIALQAQYMVHLGRDVEAVYWPSWNTYEFRVEKGGALHAHLLGTLSASWYLADLF